MLALLPRLLLCINLQEEPYHSTFTYLSCSSSNMASTDADALASSFSVEKQFEHFRAQLQDSGSLCDCIRSVAMEIESSTRLLKSEFYIFQKSSFKNLLLEFDKASNEAWKDFPPPKTDINSNQKLETILWV
ncbi:hypothetical protein Csa_016623 [Cucumis sativus]|nr:hypothetical protein Csa_016623 [Cucumis sativus]